MVTINTGNTETLDYGGNWPAPGMYHVMAMDASEHSTDDGDYVLIKFAVLAGTVAGQVGLELSSRFWLPGGSDEKMDANNVKRLLRAAVGLGLMTKDQVQKGVQVNLDFANAIGSTCVIKVEEGESKKTGKKYTQIGDYGFGIWHVTDKEVAAVPKDQTKISTGPVVAVGAGAGASKDDFGDI